MTEVRRRYTCPTCQLRFVVGFDEADPLEHFSVKIDCPRMADGQTPTPGQGAACQGHIEAQDLPAKYHVLPAEG